MLLAAKVYAARITPPGQVGSIAEIVNKVMPIVYGLVGVGLFGLFVYGGFLWLTSTGEPEKVKKAMDTMVNAVIGTVIIVFAYLAVRIVGGVLGFSLFG